MEAIIFEKVPSQQHPQVQKSSNSVQYDMFVSPRNRLNIVNMNQIFPRNSSYNKINKITTQFSQLQSIVTNFETPKHVASDQHIIDAASNLVISNSVIDENPVRSVKNQPRISNNPLLPSVFSTDKAQALKIKKLIKNQILTNYDETSVEQDNPNVDPYRQSTPNHRSRNSKSFLSPKRVVSPSNIANNMNLGQRPSVNNIYSRAEKGIRPVNNTRESARRIPNENLLGVKTEESYINASNISGIQSSSNSKKKIIIFKKFLSKSPEINIPVVDGISNRLSSALNMLDKISSPLAKLKTKISLNEMITLKKVRNTQSNGVIKRMLHAPSLHIYDIQEEPIKGPESLKEWINLWRKSFTNKENKHLLKIFTCFWNSPEGSVSVLMEAVNKNSLKDVLDMHFSLPESCIQQLATSLVSGLQEVHSVMKEPHGAICPTEIFFDSHFQPKLSPGINRQVNAQSASSQQSIVKDSEKEDSTTRLQFFKQIKHPLGELRSCSPRVSQQHPKAINKKSNQQLAADIFELGYLLLTCALGNLEFYDTTGFLNLENLKQIIELYLNQRRQGRNDCCCLLHNEPDLRRFHSGLNSTTKLRNSGRKSPMKNNFQLKSPTVEEIDSLSSKKTSPPFTLMDLLQKNNRCSESFIDFLCNCLRMQDRPEARSLSNHEFLSKEHVSSGPLIKLSELLMTNLHDQEPHTDEKFNEEDLNRVCEAIKIVLMNGDAHEIMRRFANNRLYENPQTREHCKLQDLATEMGVPMAKLLCKFRNEIFTDLLIK